AAAPAAEGPAAPPTEGVTGPRRGLAASASLVWAFARREGLEILRDRVRLSFAVAGSLLLLILFAFGVSFDVENLPFAVYDRDQSIESTRFVEAFRGTRYFTERPPVSSEAEIDRRLVSGELRLVVNIPPNFGADLLAGRRPEVGVAVDGANTFRAETVKAYVQGVVLSWMSRVAADVGGPGTSLALPFDLRTRLAYNQAFVSVDAITPGVIMLLLVLIPAAMTAVGVAREREIGSIANFEASPASVVEFLVGKQLPYVAVGMVSFVTLVACARLAFGVPFHGSAVALTLGATLYVFAATAFGLLVSTLVRTQVAAIMAAAILTVVPTINFSGFINPMSSIEGVGRWMGLFFPAAWFQTISVGSFAKGVGALDLMTCDMALAAFGVVFIALAALVLNKQEA
ncbi:MAG: ABC transporter permease, partial [Phyllobacteriaceae bacterium]|nr:ABC transporter permease [Phyllobacteriaceae bacterium]